MDASHVNILVCDCLSFSYSCRSLIRHQESMLLRASFNMKCKIADTKTLQILRLKNAYWIVDTNWKVVLQSRTCLLSFGSLEYLEGKRIMKFQLPISPRQFYCKLSGVHLYMNHQKFADMIVLILADYYVLLIVIGSTCEDESICQEVCWKRF